MRFRTKLFTLLLLLAIFSSSLVVAFLYWPTQKLCFDLMRMNVLSIAATAGAMIDPQAHNAIKNRDDQTSSAYDTIEQQLRRARNANRRQDLYVKYMYSMRPFSQDGSVAEFVVDAEETGPDKSNVGDVYKTDNPDYRVHFNEFQADQDFVRDQWGTWLTANAPIRDAKGEAVGAVGVDVSASDALKRMRWLLWMVGMAMATSIIAAYLIASFASERLTRPLTALRSALERITAGDYSVALDVRAKDEFGEVATALNKMTAGLQQREDLKSALTRYVSEDVLHDVIYAGKSSDLFSQRKKVTILFADVRGFTDFSEQVSPEETVMLLNDYFEKMIDAIFKNSGHLNKFMGDGLMALFGALRDDNHQEEHAVQAALDMRQALVDLQVRWADTPDRAHKALASLQIGIGINTGVAIVGNIGSKQRMDFTAIGDAVNLAARLEQKTRDHDVDILVSEYTYVAAPRRFEFLPTGELSIKGKANSVRTYTIKK